MKLPPLAVPTGYPGAPTPRTTRSYVVDVVAIAAYVLAIGCAAMFLDIPYAWVLAAVIAFLSLVVINPMGNRPHDRPDPSANP